MSDRSKWVLESTLECDFGRNIKLRIWRNETELRDSYDNSDLMDLINTCWKQGFSPSRTAQAIADADRVAAVHAIYHSSRGDKPDDGFVIYTDWP